MLKKAIAVKLGEDLVVESLERSAVTKAGLLCGFKLIWNKLFDSLGNLWFPFAKVKESKDASLLYCRNHPSFTWSSTLFFTNKKVTNFFL